MLDTNHLDPVGQMTREESRESNERHEKLDALEAIRKEYEQKRDYYQLLMDTTDSMIHEIHKGRIQ